MHQYTILILICSEEYIINIYQREFNAIYMVVFKQLSALLLLIKLRVKIC